MNINAPPRDAVHTLSRFQAVQSAVSLSPTCVVAAACTRPHATAVACASPEARTGRRQSFKLSTDTHALASALPVDKAHARGDKGLREH